MRVSSLHALEPLPLHAALDAIGGEARATGKLPLRLMQAEVDRLLDKMPQISTVRPRVCRRALHVCCLLCQLSCCP